MARAKPRYKPRCLGIRNGEVGMILRDAEYWYKPAKNDDGTDIDAKEWERRFQKIYAISTWKGLRFLIKRGRLVRKIVVKRLTLLDA